MSTFARFSRWSLALLVALVAVGMTFGSAAAAPRNGNEGPPRKGPALERMYRIERQRLMVQDGRLKRADQYATKIDALIARLKGKGRDTAALEQAVAAFRASMATARHEWQAASDTLASHAGFDAQGKVTDATQAAATLRDAHNHMAQAAKAGFGAYKDLHAAIAAYRKAHRDVAEPAAPAAP
jgi:hypothetical protein